jgi:hypothetical protein
MASAGYNPGREAPLMFDVEINRSLKNWPILQFSNGKEGLGLLSPTSVAKRQGGMGRPAYYTRIEVPKRSESENCRERIRTAMRNFSEVVKEDAGKKEIEAKLKELRQAYNECFRGRHKKDGKELCIVTTRDLIPLQRMIRDYHNKNLEDAIGEDDKNKLLKAIQAIEQEEAIIESTGDGKEPIILCRPMSKDGGDNLTKAKKQLDLIIKKEMREQEEEKEQQEAPPNTKNLSAPSPLPSRPVTPDPGAGGSTTPPAREESKSPQPTKVQDEEEDHEVADDTKETSKPPEKTNWDEAEDGSTEAASSPNESLPSPSTIASPNDAAQDSQTMTPTPRVADSQESATDEKVPSKSGDQPTPSALPPRALKAQEAKRQQEETKDVTPPPEENNEDNPPE